MQIDVYNGHKTVVVVVLYLLSQSPKCLTLGAICNVWFLRSSSFSDKPVCIPVSLQSTSMAASFPFSFFYILFHFFFLIRHYFLSLLPISSFAVLSFSIPSVFLILLFYSFYSVLPSVL